MHDVMNIYHNMLVLLPYGKHVLKKMTIVSMTGWYSTCKSKSTVRYRSNTGKRSVPIILPFEGIVMWSVICDLSLEQYSTIFLKNNSWVIFSNFLHGVTELYLRIISRNIYSYNISMNLFVMYVRIYLFLYELSYSINFPYISIFLSNFKAW